MRRTALLAVALLLAGCSSSRPDGAVTAPPGSDPAGTTGPGASTDPYTALAPPLPGALGGYDALTVGHAQEVVHGLLAEQLLEPSTLNGTAALAPDLSGAAGDPSLTRDLGRPPAARGLLYRPLFPAPLRLADPPGRVTRSSWTGDAVQGAGGERGLRISWSGSLAYTVTTPDGAPHQVGYELRLGYVFSALSNEPSGVRLQQLQTAASGSTGTLATCRAKGVLWPGRSGPCPV